MFSAGVYDLQMALLSKAAGAAPCAVEDLEAPQAEADAHEAGALVRSKASAVPEAHEAAHASPASALTTGSATAHAPRKRKQKHLLR